MVSHWSLSDNKSPQVSRTLLSILGDLHNAVVWMVSSHPLISKSSNPLINLLVTIITIIIIIIITTTTSTTTTTTPLEFFTSVLADGFSLEFEWQQVSSSLQDSFQYSGRSQ